MTSNHSLYKHRKGKRWEKATSEQKQMSSLTLKLNMRDRQIRKLLHIIRASNYTLKKHGEVFKKLVEEEITTKEYLKPYLPRKTEALEKTKEKISRKKEENKKEIGK